MLGWMKYKLESRLLVSVKQLSFNKKLKIKLKKLLGEISTTSDMLITPL